MILIALHFNYYTESPFTNRNQLYPDEVLMAIGVSRRISKKHNQQAMDKISIDFEQGWPCFKRPWHHIIKFRKHLELK